MSRNFCIEIDICNVPTQMQANLIARTGKLSSKIDQLPLLESSTLFRATALHALIQWTIILPQFGSQLNSKSHAVLYI